MRHGGITSTWVLVAVATALAGTVGSEHARAQATPAEPLETVEANGVRLHYLDQGAGEPIVFVHGTLGDYSFWLPHLGAFADEYRTITYSRRHSFPNDNGTPTADYSALVDAADLAALVDSLALGPVHLVGYSWGALTSLVVAVERPDLVETMVLAEPPVDPRALAVDDIPGLETTLPDWLDEWPRYGDMVRAGRVREAIGDFIGGVLGDPGAASQLPDALWSTLMRNAPDFRGIALNPAPIPPLRPSQMTGIGVPVLLIAGQANVGGPFEHQNDRLVQLIPGAEAVTIPGANHLLWDQQPEITRDAVLAFLERWNR